MAHQRSRGDDLANGLLQQAWRHASIVARHENSRSEQLIANSVAIVSRREQAGRRTSMPWTSFDRRAISPLDTGTIDIFIVVMVA
jgi:hypothetical protein